MSEHILPKQETNTNAVLSLLLGLLAAVLGYTIFQNATSLRDISPQAANSPTAPVTIRFPE